MSKMSEISDIKKEAAGKLELIAKKEVAYSDELYKVVDFLNKNLKNKKVIIGISKNGDKATISIYET